jgi:hypothetical protein
MSKEFKLPNVKAPRFRQKAHNVLNKDFFNAFREKFGKYKDVTESDIKKIVKRFNEVLSETVIETRDGVQLPEGLGHLFIGSCQSVKGKNIDYGKSSKYGVTVNNKNWETDGKLAKIFYTCSASKYKYTFRECWSFIACRNFKRTVAKTYPENWNMYVSIDATTKMKKAYTALVLQGIRDRKLQSNLKDYNEFDL